MIDRQNSKKTGSERVRAARRRAKRSSNLEYINFKAILVFILILAFIIALSFFGIKYIASSLKSNNLTETTDTLKRHVMIGEVNISGMTREQAKAAVENVYPWSMKVHLGDDADNYIGITNLLDLKLDKILDLIYSDEANTKGNYDISFADMDNEINQEIEKIQGKWDVQPKNGSIAGFDKESKTFVYESESAGYLIDESRLRSDFTDALNRKNFSADISVLRNEVKPTVTLSEAKEKYKVIGTFTTKTTDNRDRNTNISLASEALDGLIIKPGEEFSFNNTTGNRTVERGYRSAGAYVNGVLAEEPGGGVCQVSSTLYNAVIFSGLTTTERHAHSFEPSYVTPGEDAMVSYDGYAGPDMKFINTSSTSIAIRAVLTGQTLTCSIIGIPILEDGVTIEMESKKIGDLNPPGPEYIEDKNIAPGSQVVITEAKNGSKWATNYITKKDGVVVKDEPFHNSTYKGKPAKIKRNTSAAASTTKAAETSGENTDMTETLSGDDPTSSGTDNVDTSAASETVHKKQDSTKKDKTVADTSVEKLQTEAATGKADETTEHSKAESKEVTTEQTQVIETTAEETVVPPPQ